MPDLDIVERRIPSHWRRPYRLMKGGQSAEIVAEAVLKAIAAQLRCDKGVPAFDQGLRRLSIPSSPARSHNKTLSAVANEAERRLGQRAPVHQLRRASRRVQALADAGRALPTPGVLGREYAWELARHFLFGRVEPTLIGPDKRFGSPGNLLEFERRVREESKIGLSQLGNRLARSPSSSKIRAPRRRRPIRSTSQLLDEPILGGKQR